MVSKIWVGYTTTNIHLLQFKIESHLQNLRHWMLVRQHSFWREKRQKCSTLHSPFCIFAPKCFNQIATLSTLESTFLDEIIRYASRRVKPKERIVKCVTYTQPIMVSLRLVAFPDQRWSSLLHGLALLSWCWR